MLDVFFLSYNEYFADSNYELLLKKVPNARRVHGVKGFSQAHQECARRSFTNNFYVVDADALILDDFDFDFTPSKFNTWWGIPESECLCIWKSLNPINNLIYGHGGVKLLPKYKLLEKNPETIDFSTGFGLTINMFDKISNVTAFNVDELSTWRSAFRECVKLTTNLTNEELKYKLNYDQEVLEEFYEETKHRLNTWMTVGLDKKFGDYAIHGAIKGNEYGKDNESNPNALKMINDFEWIKNEFIKFFGKNQ